MESRRVGDLWIGEIGIKTTSVDSHAFPLQVFHTKLSDTVTTGRGMARRIRERPKTTSWRGVNKYKYAGSGGGWCPPPLTARWAKSHIGIAGNERADEEAKKAAQGESSPDRLLPELLRSGTRLPYSTSALKQRHNARLKKRYVNVANAESE